MGSPNGRLNLCVANEIGAGGAFAKGDIIFQMQGSYRIYFKEYKGKVIILLIGGDKSTQQNDIEKAKEIWKNLNN